MDNIATELGVPVEVLLRGLPQRLRDASDGVILRRRARLASRSDYLRVRDAEQSMDLLRLNEATPVVHAHVMPYMPLKDAYDIFVALEEEGGAATSHHREVIVANPDVLLAKKLAYRSILEQIDLLDAVSQAAEAVLTVRMEAQLLTCLADQCSARDNLDEHAWRLVLHYLEEGDILEAKKYLEACFPSISELIDANPAVAHEAYERLLTSLQEDFNGDENDLSVDIEHYLAYLASFRLMYLKATNMRFIVTLVESLISDLAKKRDFLNGRLKIQTLIGAAFAN